MIKSYNKEKIYQLHIEQRNGKDKTGFVIKIVPEKIVCLIRRASHKEPCFERNQEPDKFNDVTVRSDFSWLLCLNSDGPEFLADFSMSVFAKMIV